MKIISSKFFVIFSLVFGISFLGYLWFDASTSSQAQLVPQFVNYNHNGEQMVLTRILAADRTADTGTKACAKVRGANGQPMVCKNNVESFPYLGNKGCRQFYPNSIEHVSTYPGHGAHGGHYDLICLSNSSVGDSGACSALPVNTCTTCPQCAKNLDCDEALSSPSNFADGAIVRCFEGADPVPTISGNGDLSTSMVLKMSFDDQNANDSSGQNNHGTAQGGVIFKTTECKTGACAQFDGRNDAIFSDDAYDLPGDMAVMTWVNASVNQRVGARIIDTPRIDGVGVSMYFDSGRIVLDNGGGPNSVLPTASGFEDGRWHHVAAVRSGSNYFFYVDGNYIGARAGSKPVYRGYSLARWSNGGSYFKGSLDEVYVFGRALSADEIRQVRDHGVSAPIGSVIAPPSSPLSSPSLPPAVDSTKIDGVFLTEVKGGDTGVSACAKFNKICVGPSLFNRSACLKFYPHANTKNALVGPQTEHFCKAGSTADVCTGTLDDTCVMAVSSSQQMTCDSVADNIDSFFVECEDPFSPQIMEEMGGSVPPLSLPQPRNDGSGYVDYTVTIHHPSQAPTKVSVEYAVNGGPYQRATIESVEPSEGTVDLQNDTSYQMGSIDPVDTDQFDSVTLDFVWDSVTDEVAPGSQVTLKVTVQDASGSSTSDMTEPFVTEDQPHDAAPDEEGEGDSPEDGLLFREPPPAVNVVEDDGSVTNRDRHDHLQNCLESAENTETPCESNEEIVEFLDALVTESIIDSDWSEKERGKAEFIKRYLALQNNDQTMIEKLELFDFGMTRDEAMEMIVFLLSSHGVIFQNGNLPLEYSDVTRESPFAQAIAYATAYGIVEGYPDGTFRPDQAPNLAEVARIAVRAGALIKNSIQDIYAQEVLNDGKGDWFIPYVKTLLQFKLTMPLDYEGLGQTVSGLRFLDILYDLLVGAGLEEPFAPQQ